MGLKDEFVMKAIGLLSTVSVIFALSTAASILLPSIPVVGNRRKEVTSNVVR